MRCAGFAARKSFSPSILNAERNRRLKAASSGGRPCGRADGRARYWCGWLHTGGDRGAVDPIPNHIIRSRFTPPERAPFEPAPVRAYPKSLNSRVSHIRTKMGVVQLCQRKGPERAAKRPKMAFRAGVRCSDKWAGTPAFCGVPATVGGHYTRVMDIA
jgi:hypothetical protein